ncbi:MAG: Trm112 family protein [Acidobacteria bacterium]|nr:Trm112 family protein [Acidobacteriota bacterium]
MVELTKALRELERLVCPVCRAKLRAGDGSVVCTGCSRRYPIVDGIPVLLVDRAG